MAAVAACLVLAGDEEGGGEEVLRGSHQDLAVLGGCQVVHDAHQRQRLRARLLCLPAPVVNPSQTTAGQSATAPSRWRHPCRSKHRHSGVGK